MIDEQKHAASGDESRCTDEVAIPTLSVLLGEIESLHNRARLQPAGISRPAAVRREPPVNISKQVEALHGNDDFSFA